MYSKTGNKNLDFKSGALTRWLFQVLSQVLYSGFSLRMCLST